MALGREAPGGGVASEVLEGTGVGGRPGVDQLGQLLGEASVRASVHICRMRVLDEARVRGWDRWEQSDLRCWIFGCIHGQLGIARFM